MKSRLGPSLLLVGMVGVLPPLSLGCSPSPTDADGGTSTGGNGAASTEKAACTALYDDFEPGGAPSFADDVLPVLQQSCNSDLCHGGSPEDAQANLWLGTVDGETLSAEEQQFILASLVNVKSIAAPELALVRPGEPERSLLMLKLDECQAHLAGTCSLDEDASESGEPCGDSMPVVGKRPSEQNLDLIRSWIALGAEDN